MDRQTHVPVASDIHPQPGTSRPPQIFFLHRTIFPIRENERERSIDAIEMRSTSQSEPALTLPSSREYPKSLTFNDEFSSHGNEIMIDGDGGEVLEINDETKTLERKLLWKIDLRLCTIAGVLCSLNLLDSGIISSASVTSIFDDLGLGVGNRYVS
jgi:hypothetical protein